MCSYVLPFSYPVKNQNAELSVEELKQLLEWDREVQPVTMLPGDFVDNNGVTSIVFRGGNSAKVIDWYQRRCEFINKIKSSRNVTISVVESEWQCAHCHARARKEHTRINGAYHNPNGPAVAKYCPRCGFNSRKWYESGSIRRHEINIPKHN